MIDYPINSKMMRKLGERLKYAKQLDSKSHSIKKTKADSEWYKKAAKEADISISSSESDEEEEYRTKENKSGTKSIQSKLELLLMKPI